MNQYITFQVQTKIAGPEPQGVTCGQLVCLTRYEICAPGIRNSSLVEPQKDMLVKYKAEIHTGLMKLGERVGSVGHRI